MARTPCHFIDVYPGGLGDYPWPINHDEEQESGTEIGLTRTAPVDGIHLIRQIGDPSPIVRRLAGTILDRSQYAAFWSFLNVCRGLGPGPQRTIHWTDQMNARFEVLFTAYNPQFRRVVSNPRGTNEQERQIVWDWDATLEILNVISGWP